MRLNIATFYRKMGTFEAVCIHPPPCLVTMDYPCSAAISCDITQPCMLQHLVLMHTQLTELCCGYVGEFLSTMLYGLLRQAFILREVHCNVNRIHSRLDAVGGNPGGKLVTVCTVMHCRWKCTMHGTLNRCSFIQRGIINWWLVSNIHISLPV